jgi:hypothetical protein
MITVSSGQDMQHTVPIQSLSVVTKIFIGARTRLLASHSSRTASPRRRRSSWLRCRPTCAADGKEAVCHALHCLRRVTLIPAAVKADALGRRRGRTCAIKETRWARRTPSPILRVHAWRGPRAPVSGWIYQVMSLLVRGWLGAGLARARGAARARVLLSESCRCFC